MTSFSLDNIVQTVTGNGSATSVPVTIAATAAGNTVLIAAFTNGTNAITTPTGFTRDADSTINNYKAYMYRKSNVAASETSFTLAVATAQPIVWVAMEVNGLDRANPLDTWIFEDVASSSSLSVGSTPSGYEQLSIWFHAGINTANNTVPVWSGHTVNAEVWSTSDRQEASTAIGSTIALRINNDVPSNSFCTASSSVPVNGAGLHVVYYLDDGKRRPNPDVLTGFEFGTMSGAATGNTGVKIFDATAGTPAIVTTSPRTGTYCLELSASAAIENVTWTSAGVLSNYTGPLSSGVSRFSIYFPTSLPGADVELAAIGTPSGVTLRYRTASQKLGIQVVGSASGTEQLSTNTVSAGQWYDIDIVVDGRTSGTWTAKWQINGVDQTDATLTAQAAALSLATLRLGWGASTTATVRYDDFVFSRFYQHYPMGGVKIYAMPIDSAATPTVSGSAANFSTFTSNGTLNSTFSVTTARDAIDEIPPTIGASADGFCQDTAAGSDYVEFPMTTRTVTSNREAIYGLRWYFCGWAASATSASIGFKANTATTGVTLLGAQDTNFDNSTSAPAWIVRMHRQVSSNSPYPWNQAELDATVCQIGFSADASPVIGVHAAFAELAVRSPDVLRMLENDGVTVDAEVDRDDGSIKALTLTAPGGGTGGAATYTVFGSDQVRTCGAGASDTYVTGAEATYDVSAITAGPQ
jgi:hypothetical protein